MYSLLISTWMCATLVVASALDPGAPTSVCPAVAKRCSGRAQERSATAYCSSLLDIEDVTSTYRRGTTSVQPTCTPITHTKSPIPTRSSYIGFSSGPFKHDLAAATTRTTTSRVPAPSCFGLTSRAASCSCLSLTPSTTSTTAAKAIITGPFKMEEYRPFVYHQFAAIDVQNHGHGSNRYIIWPQKNYYAGAGSFFLDPHGHLRYAGLPDLIASEQPGVNDTGLFLANVTSGIPRPKCQIEQATCELNCTLSGQRNQFVCSGDYYQWYIRAKPPSKRELCASFAPVVQTLS